MAVTAFFRRHSYPISSNVKLTAQRPCVRTGTDKIVSSHNSFLMPHKGKQHQLHIRTRHYSWPNTLHSQVKRGYFRGTSQLPSTAPLIQKKRHRREARSRVGVHFLQPRRAAEKRLFVSGLSEKVNVASLKKIFSRKAEVTSVSIPTDNGKSLGLAFIVVESTNAQVCAQKLDKTILFDKEISVVPDPGGERFKKALDVAFSSPPKRPIVSSSRVFQPTRAHAASARSIQRTIAPFQPSRRRTDLSARFVSSQAAKTIDNSQVGRIQKIRHTKKHAQGPLAHPRHESITQSPPVRDLLRIVREDRNPIPDWSLATDTLPRVPRKGKPTGAFNTCWRDIGPAETDNTLRQSDGDTYSTHPDDVSGDTLLRGPSKNSLDIAEVNSSHSFQPLVGQKDLIRVSQSVLETNIQSGLHSGNPFCCDTPSAPSAEKGSYGERLVGQHRALQSAGDEKSTLNRVAAPPIQKCGSMGDKKKLNVEYLQGELSARINTAHKCAPQGALDHALSPEPAENATKPADSGDRKSCDTTNGTTHIANSVQDDTPDEELDAKLPLDLCRERVCGKGSLLNVLRLTKGEGGECAAGKRGNAFDESCCIGRLTIKRFISECMEPRPSLIHETGLFATKIIEKGRFVVEYTGQVVQKDMVDDVEKQHRANGILESYLFLLPNGNAIDGTHCGPVAKYLNHSCSPNLQAKVLYVDGEYRVAYFALREVKPNEELTCNYHFPLEPDEHKIECLCKSLNCTNYLN